MKDNISSYVEDILLTIGEDAEVDREEIEKEFRRFMEYGVPPDQAKSTLLKKFSGGKKTRELLSDIKPNESSVNILCRVITLNPKDVTIKGEKKRIFYGLLGDESAVVPFTSWSSSFPADKGDVIEVMNAYTKEWQGNMQINFGTRTTIKKVEDERLPNISYEPKKCKIEDLSASFGPVEIVAKVLDVSEREVEVDRVKKKVFFGTIGDETGKAQYTAWYDFNLKKGDIIHMSGGYVRSWKGIPQLIFDEKAELKKIDQQIEVLSPNIPIYKLVERRGGIDIGVEGTVIEIMEGSGYIERCPECKRPLRDGECKIHGKVKGIADLRAKLVVDDGTGGINVVVGRELTEKLIGKNLEECKKIVENQGKDAMLEIMKKMLLSKVLFLRGNALGDEYGTTLIARDAELVDIDIHKEAIDILREMGAAV